MNEQPNNQLFERLKKSDKSAFNSIFNTYYDSVFKNIYFKTRDHDISCDIAQETFIKCWENRLKIDSTKSFYYWLITIASNLTNNYFKREQMKINHHEVIKHESDTSYETDNEKLEVEQLQQKIDNIVNNFLPKKCQLIFIMSRYEGKSNAEIAEELSIAKKTVENQLYQALTMIRKKLKKSMSVSMYSFVLL